MKFILYCILMLASTISGCAQVAPLAKKHIKGNQFEGYILPKEYTSDLLSFENLKSRFTPSKEDIIKAEELIKKQLAGLNKSLNNQGNECPIIHNNLKKYRRQYLGYITNEGERIIWVNFISWKDKSHTTEIGKDVIIILDGCSYYWNIKVNLNKEKVFDLRVNGT